MKIRPNQPRNQALMVRDTTSKVFRFSLRGLSIAIALPELGFYLRKLGSVLRTQENELQSFLLNVRRISR